VVSVRAVTPAERRELDRVGAFSDGVFAIAITLLVLNVEVPDVPGSDLGSALSDLSDDLFTYAIGFAVMGLFWYGHHKLFAALGRTSGRLVLANMLLLALIALMPFTTGVLGRYDESLAVALYAANVGLAMLVDGLMTAIAGADDLYAEKTSAPAGLWETLAGAVARSLIFFLSIPVAYGVSPSAAQWCWILLAVMAVVDGRRRRAANPRSA
jgi:uncharacterized membrane protein